MIDGFEQWKSVVGSRDYYRVSSLGRILNVRRGKFQKASDCLGGYTRVSLTLPGQRTKSYLLHTIVAAAFIGPKPRGKVINHRNGRKSDNFASNLEYLTRKENCRHAVRIGLHRPFFQKGALNIRAKLTEAKVGEIRVQRACGVKLKDIARRFRVSISTVQRICSGQSWSCLKIVLSEPQQAASSSSLVYQEPIQMILNV